MWVLIVLEFGTYVFLCTYCQLNSIYIYYIMSSLFYLYIVKHEQPCGYSKAIDDDEVSQALFIH